MAILSDKGILNAIANKGLRIAPLSLNDIQPASIDLHIGKTYHRFEPCVLDLSADLHDKLQEVETKEEFTDEGIELHPGEYVVIDTNEKISIPQGMSAKILNRNSLVRFGLDVAAATFLNPGFVGYKPLLVRNFGLSTFILHTGDKICQIEFSELSSESNRSYMERHDIDAFDLAVAEATVLQGMVSVDRKREKDAFSRHLQNSILK